MLKRSDDGSSGGVRHRTVNFEYKKIGVSGGRPGRPGHNIEIATATNGGAHTPALKTLTPNRRTHSWQSNSTGLIVAVLAFGRRDWRKVDAQTQGNHRPILQPKARPAINGLSDDCDKRHLMARGQCPTAAACETVEAEAGMSTTRERQVSRRFFFCSSGFRT